MNLKLILPIVFVISVGLIFLYLAMFVRVLFLKFKTNEILDFELDRKKLDKIKRIIEDDNLQKKQFENLMDIQAKKIEYCEVLFGRPTVIAKILEKNSWLFTFFSDILKINRKIIKYSRNFYRSILEINMFINYEDTIKLYLYNLQTNFSKIKDHYEKHTVELAMVNKKIIENFNETARDFETAFNYLYSTNYDNLKKVFLKICNDLEFYCKCIPNLLVGIKVYEIWFDEIFNDVLKMSKKYKNQNQYNAEVNNLNFYKNNLNKAINELNFYDIHNTISDFSNYSNEIFEWNFWNKKNKQLYYENEAKLRIWFEICTKKLWNYFEYF